MGFNISTIIVDCVRIKPIQFSCVSSELYKSIGNTEIPTLKGYSINDSQDVIISYATLEPDLFISTLHCMTLLSAIYMNSLNLLILRYIYIYIYIYDKSIDTKT